MLCLTLEHRSIGDSIGNGDKLLAGIVFCKCQPIATGTQVFKNTTFTKLSLSQSHTPKLPEDCVIRRKAALHLMDQKKPLEPKHNVIEIIKELEVKKQKMKVTMVNMKKRQLEEPKIKIHDIVVKQVSLKDDSVSSYRKCV
uniref:Uncharacterized protein n=1 Tax=Timema poppense TaxID=170557 RepID=A0A7R9DIT7_TIMPO|nr:unnamed protein product [Timema poppensis]